MRARAMGRIYQFCDWNYTWYWDQLDGTIEKDPDPELQDDGTVRDLIKDIRRNWN